MDDDIDNQDLDRCFGSEEAASIIDLKYTGYDDETLYNLCLDNENKNVESPNFVESKQLKVIAKWEHKDRGANSLATNPKGLPNAEEIEIGAIVSRFQCEELKNSDCLRYIDYEFGAAFTCNQIETVEAEIKVLLSLNLTDEEKEDCLKLQMLLGIVDVHDREMMFFRLIPKPNENFL